MSMVAEMKKCPKCKKKYSFNPDVGLGLFCPHCAGLGRKALKKTGFIFRKKGTEEK